MRRPAVLVAAAIAILAASGLARADVSQEQALAERYAPVVRLVEHSGSCGEGLPYVPINVNVLFGEPTVALRGPWGPDLVKIAPTAKDLGRGLYAYHLDFPGNALKPGCDYLHWERRLTEGRSPVMYAHVVTDSAHPDRLALQYWFFYVFNDWNNLHEGDWEMIQLVFDAATAGQAPERPPPQIGYSQHQRAEPAALGDPQPQRGARPHPRRHPAPR